MQNNIKLYKIDKISKKIGIKVEKYGNYKGKIPLSELDKFKNTENGKLVLVTAITPTKAGEGKTTTTVALLDGLNKIGIKAIAALREPSLGPVFGMKGGATGGGKVTVEPTEEINLHFTGDMHALTSSINLISAVIDNHIYQGNELNIDPNKVVWKRALDMNDRALREITIGEGPKSNGIERQDGFIITVASELMAIMCLAENEDDFIERVKKIIVAYTYDDKPITVNDLKISNAIRKLMKEALKPNLVQTQEHNPAIIHGGPFANIAHGCNSIIATKAALKLGEVVVTEAGFGADLGAEKFLDIKCPESGLKPDLIVLVATIRALKEHGNGILKDGFANLKQHYENLKKYGVDVLIAINHFEADTPEEINELKEFCNKNNYENAFCDGYLNGGLGSTDLAVSVMSMLLKENSHFKPLYNREELSIKEKIELISKEIYRAEGVEYSELALEKIKKYEELGFGGAYVCMAKTPQSFTDDPKILNAPRNFKIHVKDVNLSAGANFIVPITGKILTMPGLPKVPAAVKMEEE